MDQMLEQQKTKRQLQAEQTKDRLFEAALSLLSEREFEDITIRDIVARAQVSIGTFYNYYSTKMEVFYETYRIADQYFSEVVAPSLTQPTAYERILTFFDYYAHYTCDLTDMKMNKLLYNANNTCFNRDPHQGMVGALITILRQGQETGEIAREDAADEIAEYLMISVRGLAYNWCTRNGSYDLAAATQPFVRRLLHAYFPR